MRKILSLACLFAMASAVPAGAHHSFAAEFSADQSVNLVGTVTILEWVNPHAWIHIDVKRPDGKVETWKIEGATPNTLIRRGFTKESLPPGTAIRVMGYRAKDGSLTANGRDITFADGRTVFMGSSGTGAPYDKSLK